MAHENVTCISRKYSLRQSLKQTKNIQIFVITTITTGISKYNNDGYNAAEEDSINSKEDVQQTAIKTILFYRRFLIESNFVGSDPFDIIMEIFYRPALPTF